MPYGYGGQQGYSTSRADRNAARGNQGNPNAPRGWDPRNKKDPFAAVKLAAMKRGKYDGGEGVNVTDWEQIRNAQRGAAIGRVTPEQDIEKKQGSKWGSGWDQWRQRAMRGGEGPPVQQRQPPMYQPAPMPSRPQMGYGGPQPYQSQPMPSQPQAYAQPYRPQFQMGGYGGQQMGYGGGGGYGQQGGYGGGGYAQSPFGGTGAGNSSGGSPWGGYTPPSINYQQSNPGQWGSPSYQYGNAGPLGPIAYNPMNNWDPNASQQSMNAYQGMLGGYMGQLSDPSGYNSMQGSIGQMGQVPWNTYNQFMGNYQGGQPGDQQGGPGPSNWDTPPSQSGGGQYDQQISEIEAGIASGQYADIDYDKEIANANAELAGADSKYKEILRNQIRVWQQQKESQPSRRDMEQRLRDLKGLQRGGQQDNSFYNSNYSGYGMY